ncbi:hypothetical protein D6D13_06135 [Aureobasidium pullulans]|uniref:Uncharacterized protein n=1 Tax=Aureobasidium pullulans TaxID=5580 RepID=A0A4S9CSS7_AURPU|nr:hypothetical protein D6D13_06135 [Aureobasidium pullulans]
MLDTITYLLCERSVGSLIILIDIAIFLWYFVLVPLSPSCTLCKKKTSTVSLPCDVDHLVTLMSVEVTTVLLPKRPSFTATRDLPGTYYTAYPYD